MKNTYSLTLAAIALAAASVAHAEPVLSTNSVALVPHGDASWSAGISKTHTQAGDFTDVFNLDGIDAAVTIDGLLSTLGRGASNIDFYSVSLNGHDFSFSKTAGGAMEKALLDAYDFSGPLVLTVTGFVGAAGAAPGSDVFATYSGNLNVTAENDVPEPASFALAGIGLLAAAFARRRKAQA